MPILQKRDTRVTNPVIPTEVSRFITHNCKIKPNSVVIYKRYHGFKSAKSEAELQNLEKGKSGEYNGYMSPATTRKVRTLLENWLLALEQDITDNWRIDTKTAMANARGPEYYPTFVTLTLPAKQLHDDNYIKREMLNRYIVTLKTRYNVGHYFWRAEPQKNGSIHFHILTDRWIHYKAIRYEWNRILDDHGYIEVYRQNQLRRHKGGYRADIAQINTRIDMMQERDRAAGKPFDLKAARTKAHEMAKNAYDEGVKNNWSDPNSTDIHAIEKVESLTAYVVKYVTKKADNKEVTVKDSDGNEIKGVADRKIIGRIWGCSDGLRELKHFDAEIATEIDFNTHTHDNDAYEFVRHLEREAKVKQETNPDDESVWHDEDSGTTVYRLDQKSYTLIRTLFPILFEQYAQFYAHTYATLYKKSVERNCHIFSQFVDLANSDTYCQKSNIDFYEKAEAFPSDFGVYRRDCPF